MPGEVPHAEIPLLMSTADVFVLPSHTEAFPNVILEAMSLARAIVATSVGAIPEMLRDGDDLCGQLVPPRDAAALEDALADLLGDPLLRERLGQRARQLVARRFDVEVVCDQYLDLWMGAPQAAEGRSSNRDRVTGG